MAIGIKTSLITKDKIPLPASYAHNSTWTYAGDTLSHKPYGSHPGRAKWTVGGRIYSKYKADGYILTEDYSWASRSMNISSNGGQYVWNGSHVFSIGDSVYIGLSGSNAEQEELTSSPSSEYPRFSNKTWTIKNDDGTESTLVIAASYLWTDGGNVYYSNNGSQYVLVGGYWKKKEWKKVVNEVESTFYFYGSNIWSDGESIYYSSGTDQYVLAGDVWIPKQWEGVTSFSGSAVWSDGNNFYLSSTHVLQDGAWASCAWSGVQPYADALWTDGRNIYYSTYQGDTYILGANYILGITISPKYKTLRPGDTLQFEVTVDGEGEASNDVTFSIVTGNVASDTTISADGLLTIGEEAYSRTITVRATSNHTPSMYAEARISVIVSSGGDSGGGSGGDSGDDSGGDSGGDGDSTVTGLVTSASSISLKRGENATLTATVQGTGDFNSKVEFELTGVKSAETYYDLDDGVIYVSKAESSEEISITFTSAEDSSYTKSVPILVTNASDIKPVYRRKGSEWVRVTAYIVRDGKWDFLGVAEEYTPELPDDNPDLPSGDGETIQVDSGLWLYNGVRLPAPPEDVLDVCPYYYIIDASGEGIAGLFAAATPFYYADGTIYPTSYPVYMCLKELASVSVSPAWDYIYPMESDGEMPIEQSGYSVLFTNHDIPDGSADATEIYMDAMEAEVEYIYVDLKGNPAIAATPMSNEGGSPTGYWIYDTVRCPAPPEDLLSSMPYYCLATVDGSADVIMVMSKCPCYYADGDIVAIGALTFLGYSEDGNAWEIGGSGYGAVPVYANYNLPNGSADATEFFIKGIPAVIEYA